MFYFANLKQEGLVLYNQHELDIFKILIVKVMHHVEEITIAISRVRDSIHKQKNINGLGGVKKIYVHFLLWV